MCRNGRYKRLSEALDLGFPVDTADQYGNTLLLLAAQQTNQRIVEMLMDRRANINHQNNLGNTALHYAMAYDTDGALGEYLIGRGADDMLENKQGLSREFLFCWCGCAVVVCVTSLFFLALVDEDLLSFLFSLFSFLCSLFSFLCSLFSVLCSLFSTAYDGLE
jgi:hypothetical protein